MNPSVQAAVKKGELLNKKIIERCQVAEDIIKEITLAYNQPVSEKSSFVISFVGRFKTGKSSLINALLGMELLPTKATTATSVVTRIIYGKNPKCWLNAKNMHKKISIEKAKNIILSYKVTDVQNPVEVMFQLPIPWLKGNIELRDTPGMDDSSQDGKLEQIALSALRDTDLCVCVYDASTMISEKERERTRTIHKMMSGNLVYAINCMNRLNSIESVNEVEQLAKSFFGAFNHLMPGMGKYYLMCSAPQMIELDGFDKWLKDFVNKKNLSMLNRLRKNTGDGQVAFCRERFDIEVRNYVEQIEQQIIFLNDMHEDTVKLMQKANILSAQEEAAEFNKKVANLEKDFTTIHNSLIEKIQECKNNGSNYEIRTKAVTQDYFVERYKSIISSYGNYFSRNDIQFITQAFQNVSFPGTHTKLVKATSGEKNGWTIAGTVIGTMIAPGVGSIIGAALGRGFGAVDNAVDDSVDNTMSFIKNTIVPLMKKTINSRINKINRDIKNKGNCECHSGLETMISETISVQKMLGKY